MALVTHKIQLHDDEKWPGADLIADDAVKSDCEFGGTVARARLEKKLLWKLDSRMSILVVIYILNIVFIVSFYLLF